MKTKEEIKKQSKDFQHDGGAFSYGYITALDWVLSETEEEALPEPNKKIEHIEEMTVYRRYGNVPALWQLFDKVNELVDSNNRILDELRGKQ